MRVTGKIRKAVVRALNASDWPQPYGCSFLEQGIISYEDVGMGKALLTKATIDECIQSFVGKPVIIFHQDITPENFEEHAVGYITKVEYNVGDGLYHCEFLLTSDDAKRKVKMGYKVSCGYTVSKTGPSGTWHCIPYTEEIKGFVGEHLALVPNPRYEKSDIYEGAMMVNSKAAVLTPESGKPNAYGQDGHGGSITKEGKGMNIIGKIKKALHAAVGPEVDDNDPAKKKWSAEDMTIDVDGEHLTVAQLMDFADGDDELVEVQLDNDIEGPGGKKLKLNELIENYKKKKAAKKNADDDDAAKKAKEDEDRKNAEADADAKKKEEEADVKKKENRENGTCDCDKKDGEEHKDNCSYMEKKNADEKAAKDKADAEEADKVAKAKAEKDEADKKENDKKEAERVENEKRENARVEKEAADKKKKGNDWFVKLNGLKDKPVENGLPVKPTTINDKLSRGKSRYGSETKAS